MLILLFIFDVAVDPSSVLPAFPLPQRSERMEHVRAQTGGSGLVDTVGLQALGAQRDAGWNGSAECAPPHDCGKR
jgi:hypothetical protein